MTDHERRIEKINTVREKQMKAAVGADMTELGFMPEEVEAVMARLWDGRWTVADADSYIVGRIVFTELGAA